jgi:glucose 1-dehydrogenase
MRLENKIVLVTGANSGIGKSIAERFAAEGAHVAVNYLPGGHRQEDSQAEVQTFGPRGIAVGGDVGNRNDVQAMVDQVVKTFGRLDIAVSNAGIEAKTPFWELPDDQWERILRVNLYGSFYVSQIAVRQMMKQGKDGGKIVFVSSIHEDVPFPGYASYCVSKGGVRMLMRNIALEMAPYNITANNIAPGAIATPINAATLANPEAYKAAVSQIPLGRFGKPEEVANLALFLASNESNYVTGSTYYMDGGLVQAVTKY